MTISTRLVIVLWLFFLSYIDCIDDKDVRVLKDERVFNSDGSYYYIIKLSNDQDTYEKGYLKKDKKTGEEFLVKEGYSTYIGPDGKTYTVIYIADENGYMPKSKLTYNRYTSISNANQSLGCGFCDIANEEAEPKRRRRKILLLLEIIKKSPYF